MEEEKKEENSPDKSESQANQMNRSQAMPFKRMRTVRDGRHERQGFSEDCFYFIQ